MAVKDNGGWWVDGGGWTDREREAKTDRQRERERERERWGLNW